MEPIVNINSSYIFIESNKEFGFGKLIKTKYLYIEFLSKSFSFKQIIFLLWRSSRSNRLFLLKNYKTF
jgi:hypothetical protein